MEIYHLEEHLACFHYNGVEDLLIDVKIIRHQETKEVPLTRNNIVFILEGSLQLTLRNNPGGEVCRGMLVFLPAGDHMTYKALTRSLILVIQLTGHLNICHTFSIERLYKKAKTKAPKSLCVLRINSHLWHFANGIVTTYADGLKCRHLFEAKITELMILIRAYYSDTLLYNFFYPILSPDTKFLEFVRTNHLKYRTASELATAMRVTNKQFTKKFKEVFAQTPYEWMKGERARLIYNDIKNSNKPFKQIAYEYGFVVPAHFTNFCKSVFDKTPEKIRNEEIEYED